MALAEFPQSLFTKEQKRVMNMQLSRPISAVKRARISPRVPPLLAADRNRVLVRTLKSDGGTPRWRRCRRIASSRDS